MMVFCLEGTALNVTYPLYSAHPGLAAVHALSNGTHLWTNEAGNKIGDGRCPIWAFEHVAGNRSTLTLIGADGEPRAQFHDVPPRNDSVPLGSWSVDSARAARWAMAEWADGPSAAKHPQATAMYSLYRQGQAPAFWHLTMTHPEMASPLRMIVNANLV